MVKDCLWMAQPSGTPIRFGVMEQLLVMLLLVQNEWHNAFDGNLTSTAAIGGNSGPDAYTLTFSNPIPIVDTTTIDILPNW